MSYDFENELYYSFESIPYAKPPIGRLRFKAPEPPEPWKGILNATKPGALCPQISELHEYIDENCLLLNIYTKMDKKLQPVFVFIPGGGFQYGGINGIEKLKYGPQFIVPENVVLVEIQYRLNIFGFISFNDTKYGIPGNAGFKDQVMALKWIQKNIADFGGDPSKVTLHGQSAGATSVNLLTLSPLSKGLFHRAIAQSGASTSPWLKSSNKALELAAVLNCPLTTLDEIVYCINNTSMYDLLTIGLQQLAINIMAQPHLRNGDGIAFNTLTIENESLESFITKSPEDLAKNGGFQNIPFVIGYNIHERYAFLNGMEDPVKPNFTDARDLIPKDLSINFDSKEAYDLGKSIQEFYYGNQTPSFNNIDNYIDCNTDTVFLRHIYHFAKLYSRKLDNVYFYQFDYWSALNSPGVNIHSARKIVTHNDDLPYLYYDKNKNYSIEDPNIPIGIYRLVKLWTRFAKTGNPNSPSIDPLVNVTWLPIQQKQFNYLHINPQLKLKVNPNAESMKFWEKICSKYK